MHTCFSFFKEKLFHKHLFQGNLNSNDLFCPKLASRPMPRSWEGEMVVALIDMCVSSPLVKGLVLVGVWLRMTPPQLWTSQQWQGQNWPSGHRAFFSLNPWPLHFMASLEITTIAPQLSFNPWQQLHNSFLFGDYQNTNRNSMFGCISFCLLADWGLRKLPRAPHWIFTVRTKKR